MELAISNAIGARSGGVCTGRVVRIEAAADVAESGVVECGAQDVTAQRRLIAVGIGRNLAEVAGYGYLKRIRSLSLRRVAGYSIDAGKSLGFPEVKEVNAGTTKPDCESMLGAYKYCIAESSVTQTANVGV